MKGERKIHTSRPIGQCNLCKKFVWSNDGYEVVNKSVYHKDCIMQLCTKIQKEVTTADAKA